MRNSRRQSLGGRSGSPSVPKIQFTDLPLEIARHFRRKRRQRKLTEVQLQQLIKWALTEPEASAGDWYKRFDGFILCGTGVYPKTVLDADMTPYGTELE